MSAYSLQDIGIKERLYSHANETQSACITLDWDIHSRSLLGTLECLFTVRLACMYFVLLQLDGREALINAAADFT